MRCLEPAAEASTVDAREIDQPGGGEDLRSPYLDEDELDLPAGCATRSRWPCRPRSSAARTASGCARVCGENLNEAGPEHAHEREPDPRWAALRELKLD